MTLRSFEIPPICPGLKTLKSENITEVTVEKMRERAPGFVPEGRLPGASFFVVGAGKSAELSLSLGCEGISPMTDNFMLVEKGASLTYIRHAGSSCRHLDRLMLGDGAKALMRFTQDEQAPVHLEQHARLGRGAMMKSGSYWLWRGASTCVTELGEGAAVEHVDICSLRDAQELTLSADVTHSAGSRSDILMKGVLRDTSRALLAGNARIGPQSPGSSSRVEQALLLMDEGAHGEARPCLEIQNNDVQCSHSVSVREIPKPQLFYLMSRGLPEQEAKRMIVGGFLESGLERMKRGFSPPVPPLPGPEQSAL